MTGRFDEPGLSASAFSAALATVSEISLAPDRSARLQFEVADARWHLVVDRGRVAAWQPGELVDPDVRIQWGIADAWRIAGRTQRGDDALRATTVIARAAGAPYHGPPAPLNLMCRPELDALPVVAGATLRVQYRYRAGPFGDVNHVLSFENGRLVEESLGVAVDPDVEVDVTYRAMALVRCGEMTILEALENGSLSGDLGPLATLAGISESDEFRAVELASGRHALALAVLGELDLEPAYATACQAIAAALEPS